MSTSIFKTPQPPGGALNFFYIYFPYSLIIFMNGIIQTFRYIIDLARKPPLGVGGVLIIEHAGD
ncbi:MAG: hypothetical protein A2W19_14885 [Spirochaetes bacterium RBG_16_49_21]|nr:MAG: hypothetical protein A2W19_14885 [Spirochaetes bacterium RBG_16_49_21]